jgi:hypothetical protein
MTKPFREHLDRLFHAASPERGFGGALATRC